MAAVCCFFNDKYVNPSGVRMLGYTSSLELLGRNATEALMSDKNPASIGEQIKKQLDSGQVIS
jgi:PAS domain S-box-containing protein